MSEFAYHQHLQPPGLITLPPNSNVNANRVDGLGIDCDAVWSGLDDYGQKSAHAIAEIAAERFERHSAQDVPSPLYIRPPDAAPSSDPPPVILP